MAEDTKQENVEKNLAKLVNDEGLAKRIRHYVEQGKALIAQNEIDVVITDYARVLAELILTDKRVLPRSFWSVVALSTSTGEAQFFDTAYAASTFHTGNIPAASEFSREHLFFANGFRAMPDRDMTQADKRICLNDHIFELKLHDRTIIQEKIRTLRAGVGLDGELNNGAPDGKGFVLPFWLRFAPNQKFEAKVYKKVALSGSDTDLEIEMFGILGDRK